MTEQTLTALYDTQGAAAAARDEMLKLGIPAGQVTVQGDDGVAAAGAASGEDRGFWGSLKDVLMPEEDRETFAEGVRRGGYLLTARVAGDEVERAYEVLDKANPVDLEERSTTWRQEGWGGTDGATRTTTTTTTGAAEAEGLAVAGDGRSVGGDGEVLQVAEERLRVGKREVARGAVRVRSYVTERPVEERVTLRDETVRVERRPVDREVRAGDAVFQERAIEAVERDEEAVVSKTARVVEEVTLGKRVEDRTETVRDTVRKQEVEVVDERAGHGVAAAGGGTTTAGRETVGTGKVTTGTTTDRPVR